MKDVVDGANGLVANIQIMQGQVPSFDCEENFTFGSFGMFDDKILRYHTFFFFKALPCYLGPQVTGTTRLPLPPDSAILETQEPNRDFEDRV